MDLKRLDREFSLLVRGKAIWICACCGGDFEDKPEELHCSHFWSRVNHSVRFDPENCDALCWECHNYFDMHPVRYGEWKIERMGQERFNALAFRARQITKIDRKLMSGLIKGIKVGLAAA